MVYALDGGDIVRFNFNEEILIEVDQTNSSLGSSRKIVVSGDGNYLYRGWLRFLANNLSSNLGTFGESIFATNYDGSIAIGDEHIWDATTYSIIKPLPVNSGVMEMDPNDNTVYIYDTNTSKVYLVNIE